MASELFHDLLQRAWRLDCPYIHTLNALTHSLGPGPTTERVLLAESLYEAGKEFLDSIDEYAMKHAPRSRQIKLRCPHCGDPYCGGAVPVVPVATGYIVISGPKPPTEESGK